MPSALPCAVHACRALAVALMLTACTNAVHRAEAEEETVRVELSTTLGSIELELYPERAPLSTANFLRYVDEGLFDGASFYRVVREDNDASATPIQVVQGGLMGDTFRYGTDEQIDTELPGLAPIAHETTTQTGLRNRYGVIALGRLDPGTATSEFFVNMTDNPSLDTDGAAPDRDGAGYATFGRVVAGMDVLESIQDLPTAAPKRASADLAAQVLDNPITIRAAVRR